jgi:signal transduction histidine kinase
MKRDHHGRLWVGTDSGLWILEGRRFKRVIQGRILNLTLGPDDTLWASGSPGGTVYQVDTRTLSTKTLRVEPLPVARITPGLTIDEEGRPWVASEQDGVVRGTRKGAGWSWETMSMDGSTPRAVKGLLALPGGGILMLHDQAASLWKNGVWHRVPNLLQDLPFIASVDSNGNVVIAYKNCGSLTLYALKNDSLDYKATLEVAAPGTNMVFYGVAFGANGRIWLGTARGLGYVDGTDPRSFRLLGTEDRIVSPECDQSAILVEPDRVWIGTPSGLMSYDPIATQVPKELRRPLILSARAGSQELDFVDRIPELTRDHNELEVRFMVPNYQIQDALSYAAKLSGVDADWVNLDTPYLRYGGLQAGPHVLELRGVTRQGVLGPVTTLHFTVRPEWWERWWVRGLGLLGLIGLIIALVKLRQAQLEQRNRELMEEVARQTSAPLAASKAKSAFLANMSHELRTPLNAILLYSEILQEDMRDPALVGLRKDAEKIQSAGKHLLGLIDDILDMSKIEAGHIRLDIRKIEFPSFFEELDVTVRPLIEKNQNRFEVDIREIPDHIYSDPTRLRQILVNLLSNSAKFTSHGHVLLRAWSEGDYLLTMVQDNGIGMTPEQQAKVFDEFVQADDSTTRKFGGTGLGLTLVKKFTDLLGADLTLDSMPGSGTTFLLKVPQSGPKPKLEPEVE